ncbi:hypothetical protein Phou_002000 [Phytohabitans houttuyneae]|uniref:VOC domain-containing protein n=1 Tax=Phytohabitans houttuyneae TaxID=1076126 RepID=A0A6V8JXJ9_9ACTN|nr:hypothetical protein Phou_002000 [Phytohabitans houttuyneae]
MNWTLEVVVVPVSDVDRAKAFYADQLGFNVDHDTAVGDSVRIVQLTPPGSGCSVVIGKGAVPEMPPGSLKGLQLVVADLQKARAELVERGVEVSEIQVLGENPSPTPDPLDNVGFVFFSDPDGNSWGCSRSRPAPDGFRGNRPPRSRVFSSKAAPEGRAGWPETASRTSTWGRGTGW